jgi:hypothetical protein
VFRFSLRPPSPRPVCVALGTSREAAYSLTVIGKGTAHTRYRILQATCILPPSAFSSFPSHTVIETSVASVVIKHHRDGVIEQAIICIESSIHSRRSASPGCPASIRFVAAPNTESEEWVRVWENTTAQGTCNTLSSPPILTSWTSPGRRPGSRCRSRHRGRRRMRCEHASLPSAHLELSRQSHTAPPIPRHLMPRRKVIRSASGKSVPASDR